jgi:hypothetical protein
VLLVLTALLASSAGWAGVRLRDWWWDATESMRFRGDINNGFRWGLRVIRNGQELHPGLNDDSGRVTWRQFFAGYVSLYNRDLIGQNAGTGWTLDYAPLRLLAMSLWVKSILAQNPYATTWQHDNVWPLLWFNTICELASAVLMFFLVRLWVARSRDRAGTDVRAWACGLVAALLVWFNPAVLMDAHGWPQWDVWCVPFFIGAVLCCSLDWWLTAGALIAIGAMLKGQVLLAAPVLLLWPVFRLQIGAALRLVIGASLATAIIGAPWIVGRPLAWVWIAGVALAAVIAYPWRLSNSLGRAKWALPVAALALVVWPWCRPGVWMWSFVGVLLAAAVVVVPRLIEPRARPHVYAGLLTVTMAFAFMLFNGSLAWFEVGVTRAATHFDWMAGNSVGNLPAIMGQKYGWSVEQPAWTIPPLPLFHNSPIDVSLDTVLSTAFGVATLLCAIGAARHSRTRDVRFLIAIAAPWVIFFAILPRMHERYLVWAAAITAAGVGVGVGMTLLHLVVTALALAQICHTMFKRDPGLWPTCKSIVDGLYPEIGWLVLLLAGVYLYMSLAPSRRRPHTSNAPVPIPVEPLELSSQPHPPQEIALSAPAPGQA